MEACGIRPEQIARRQMQTKQRASIMRKKPWANVCIRIFWGRTLGTKQLRKRKRKKIRKTTVGFGGETRGGVGQWESDKCI